MPECRREAFETEARRDFSRGMPTQAYLQTVKEAERETPRRARDRSQKQGCMNSPRLEQPQCNASVDGPPVAREEERLVRIGRAVGNHAA